MTNYSNLLVILFAFSCSQGFVEFDQPLPENNNVSTIIISSPPKIIDESKEEVPIVKEKEFISSHMKLTLINQKTANIERIIKTPSQENIDLSNINDGTYTLITEVSSGYRPPAPQTIEVKNRSFKSINLEVNQISESYFHYHWELSDENYEYEYSANDNIADTIEYLGEDIDILNSSSSKVLKEKYNIVLINNENTWTNELATRLLKAVESIPHYKWSNIRKLSLTSNFLADDIKINNNNITISEKAFFYASDKLVKLNNQRGRFFSKRLFQALVILFTNYGKNKKNIKKILLDKFSLVIDIDNYKKLTGEHADNFQSFYNSELIKIIHAMSEMPQGYYKIPGLKYLVRRKDGHPHPLYPSAAAVAWPRGANTDSYIEFMDKAFSSGSEDSTHRLILHEKSHFLWKNVFIQEVRDDWADLGGWYENPDVSSGWSTSHQTDFVTPYAHNINPNEDMAESLAHYVLNPEKLRSVAPDKFEFIKERIMNGYRYVSMIREDLTFQVLNLFPDYDFPGKIEMVDVKTHGGNLEDKRVEIIIRLRDKEGIDDGAERAYARIFSPNNTYKDVYFYPHNGDDHTLKGTFSIDKNSKRGYWKMENITIYDRNLNTRMESITDYGFKLFINNKIEDLNPPTYIKNSLAINKIEKIEKQKQLFDIKVQWEINEDIAMKKRHPVYANLIYLDDRELYPISAYGNYNKQTSKASVNFELNEYFPSGTYAISYIHMEDQALNKKGQYFSNDPKHEKMKKITLSTRNGDLEAPSLDTNKIAIKSDPINPTSPDGRTKVHIVFYAKDDKSGIGTVYYKLRNPLGKIYFNYFYHSNFYTKFFNGDPTIEKRYDIKTTLPRGSAPGKWVLLEMVLVDKAGNIKTYNFLETVHFQLE